MEITESMSVSETKTIFASDIGWKPGEWRSSITFEGLIYDKSHSIICGDELVGWIYRSEHGKEVMIYND